MRSRLRVLTLALLLAVLPMVARGQAPTRNEIKHAVDKVKADPNLAPQKTVRTLKWVHENDPEPPDPDSRGLLKWFLDLMGWFAQSARIVIWVGVALLTGLLVVFVLRLIKEATEHGTSVIVISHNLEHVIEVADRAVVLRQGRYIGEEEPTKESQEKLVSMIVGGDSE